MFTALPTIFTVVSFHFLFQMATLARNVESVINLLNLTKGKDAVLLWLS
jgi:hypothetical protein